MKIPDKIKLWLIGLSFLVTTGCVSTKTLETKLSAIKEKHNITVKTNNPLSRCYLFGNLPKLLDRIDRDLENSPRYFKENIGEIEIEEWFFDNLEVLPFPSFFVRGYVNPRDEENRYSIHIKNRNLLEKILVFHLKDDELFLHEATHSFLGNTVFSDERILERVNKDWEEAQGWPHLPPVLGQLLYGLIGGVPPIAYLRAPSMPSFYGWVNDVEDIAECYCYLRRHNWNVEFLKEKDESLYKKCKIVNNLVEGRYSEL